MRWIVILLAVLSLAAGGQAATLNNQVVFSGTGYDVRLSDKANGRPIYEAAAAYSGDHSAERQQISTNILYRGLTRVKADGYDFALVEGPSTGSLTRTTMQGGRVIGTKQYPAIEYRLTGFRKDGPHPPNAVDIDKALISLKPKVTSS